MAEKNQRAGIGDIASRHIGVRGVGIRPLTAAERLVKKVVPATGAAHTLHTVPGDALLKKGENRTLDFLPQKTVARLEVFRSVPRKFLETRLGKPVVVGTFRMPASIKTHFVPGTRITRL